MARILVDTSALYALLDRSDANHQSARAILQALKKRRAEPLLTNFLVAESHALILARLGADTARRWLFGNVWAIEPVTDGDEAKARQILARYVDKTFSYTDATSFAVMERRSLRTAFAFDPHFRQYGFQLAEASSGNTVSSSPKRETGSGLVVSAGAAGCGWVPQ